MKHNRKVLNEGGNAIKTSIPIKKEYLDKSLQYVYSEFLPALKVKKSDTALLGSTGKKPVSGDIDFAIDIKPIIKNNNNIQTIQDVINFIEDKANSFFDEVVVLKGLDVISVGLPIVGEKNQVAQLDIMPTDNLNFSTWMYYSPSEIESKYKGLYRNCLLSMILREGLGLDIRKRIGDTPVEWERYYIDFAKGLMKIIQSKEGKDGKILKNHKTIKTVPVTKDPDTIIGMLFSDNVSVKDVITFDGMLQALKNSDRYKGVYSNIIEGTKECILQKGYPIPEELN